VQSLHFPDIKFCAHTWVTMTTDRNSAGIRLGKTLSD